MKQIIKRGSFLTLMFLLLGCLSLYAADNDLITRQITITLEKAGTLPDRIASSKKYKITNLKIIGEINGTDLRMIREMAGGNYTGNSTAGKLSVLDLSEAKIVKGGDYYYSYNDIYNNNYYYTSNDVIGSYAFSYCSGLTSLTLPAGITEIGSYAFGDCSGLTSLNLPTGITSIGSDVFRGCSGLTSLTLPAGITKIGFGTFYGCSGLTSLTLPASITEIGNSAFRGCSGLTNLTLPAGITKIGSYAFSDCSGLTSLTLPTGITSIGESAFHGCSGLTSLTLPAGITSIGDETFRGCSGLTSLTLPAGITWIDSYAFLNCSGLTSLTLPAGITWIGERAFYGCSGLTSIYVYAEKVPEIGSNAFERFDAKKCTLYVPMGTRDDYRLSEFGDYFENIVEFESTGIDKTTTSTDVEEVARYSVNGQRLSAPTKGLNIVKYSDGSVKKVAVR
ncbi:leucine-rich repeat domain-containing protein [Prevotella sp.]|uniref:leucine-rich repeat domain-containing protein n=1 Tax=Prevotella sp. TaxID=59823 RepID=UPI00307A1C42